ncbi:MAG: alanine racemase [Oligoflexia bacterium]|nr:alanine racemase [Oligoflexia bacterium]
MKTIKIIYLLVVILCCYQQMAYTADQKTTDASKISIVKTISELSLVDDKKMPTSVKQKKQQQIEHSEGNQGQYQDEYQYQDQGPDQKCKNKNLGGQILDAVKSCLGSFFDGLMYKTHKSIPPINLNKVIIDLDVFKNNIEIVKKDRLQGEINKLCVVLKVNAYGHGVRQLVRVAYDNGVRCVAVNENSDIFSITQELKQPELSKMTIMRLNSVNKDYVEQATKYANVIEVIKTADDLDNLVKIVEKQNVKFNVQLRVDLNDPKQFDQIIEKLKTGIISKNHEKISDHINVVGIFSHFEDETEDYLNDSLKKFKITVDDLIKILDKKREKFKIHIASSPEIVLNKKDTYFDYVRVGTLLYGQPNRFGQVITNIKPIMSIKSYLSSIQKRKKDEKITYAGITLKNDAIVGTVPVGVNHGMSDATNVLIKGKRFPILAVNNDELYIDLKQDDTISSGDVVVLLGKSGNEEIVWADLAGRTTELASGIVQTKKPAENISYAVMAGFKYSYVTNKKDDSILNVKGEKE